MPHTEEPGRDGAGEAPRGVNGDGATLPGSPAEEPVDDISLVRLLNVLLRNRRLVVGLPLAAAILVVGITIVLPRTYTTQAVFLPEGTEQDASRLIGLAAQFGFSVPGARGGETPEFYAGLLRSRELLKAAVETRYDLGGAEATSQDRIATLVEYYRLEDEPPDVGVAKAMEKLRKDLRVRTRQETGVVEVDVTTRLPDLSHQVTVRLLALLNEFNLDRRQSQAAAERVFIEGRLREAEEELHEAEERLEAFLQRNRRYQQSPELTFEFERLQRRVNLRQQVYTSLAQSYEQARIEEVRNTPVITVVDPPEPPPRPDPRELLLKAILAMLVTGTLAAFWALGREFVRAAREDKPDEYEEFERLKAETGDQLKGAWVRVRRMARLG